MGWFPMCWYTDHDPSLMIVDYFDRLRLFIRPAKADPVLLIDSNTVLAFTISRKRLQAISRRNTEIL